MVGLSRDCSYDWDLLHSLDVTPSFEDDRDISPKFYLEDSTIIKILAVYLDHFRSWIVPRKYEAGIRYQIFRVPAGCVQTCYQAIQSRFQDNQSIKLLRAGFID